jgi:hypothetical protein
MTGYFLVSANFLTLTAPGKHPGGWMRPGSSEPQSSAPRRHAVCLQYKARQFVGIHFEVGM